MGRRILMARERDCKTRIRGINNARWPGPAAARYHRGQMRVLGIETSCDETGVAVYDSDRGLLAHVLYSQVAMHAEYGGVVPELASRDHIRKLLPLVRQSVQARQLELVQQQLPPHSLPYLPLRIP